MKTVSVVRSDYGAMSYEKVGSRQDQCKRFIVDYLRKSANRDLLSMGNRLSEGFGFYYAEWLTPNNTVDHLGMEISMTQEAIYLCMYKYILDMLQTLDYMGLRISKLKYNVPINKDIEKVLIRTV